MELQTEDNPKWKSISAMATYFCVTTDYLMGKTDKNLYFDQIEDHVERKDNSVEIPQEVLNEAVDLFVHRLKKEYSENGQFTNLIKGNGGE